MREIKFRAWLGNGKMYYPNSFTIDSNILNKPSISFHPEDMGGGTVVSIDIMQYTGLKDKNGKEIYEGDIVRAISDVDDWNKSTDGVQVIEFWNGQFVFNAHREFDDDYINFGWWVRSNNNTNILHQLEVIGNIYENPESLHP